MSCVIVLGCYRSGTSAVAGILHHLGVMMGKEFDKPAKSNPTGYYEDLEFKRLFDMMAEGKDVEGPYYVRNPFTKEPDFGVASINYDLSELLARATEAKGTL